VSRILVADDNSNIQKMVALALKDEGIDVVAVGNGEAAMRKIPDLRPDLVLADIFMPVRNGYEVCEFVKSDSRYMSTPVVLLVGAFDPLDEQETQRVRADGVLKKPFVPPDPLINMVKALLAKSNGQKPVPTAVATPSKPVPQPQTAPASQPSSGNEGAAAPAGELPQPQGTIIIPAQEKPPAFVAPAPPIRTQIASTQDSDEVVTAVRDPNLGEPFWATPA
jgi:CheY-like chemotaxis protein